MTDTLTKFLVTICFYVLNFGEKKRVEVEVEVLRIIIGLNRG